MTEDEMVGWHHRLNRHETEYTLGSGQVGLSVYATIKIRKRLERELEGKDHRD